MSNIEFSLQIIFVNIVAWLMFFSIKVIIRYLSDILEELKKLNQNK